MASSDKKRAAQLNQEIAEVLRQRPKKAGAATGPSPQPSGISSQAAYENHELRKTLTRIDEIRWAPLAAREKAYGAFLKVLQHEPERVAECIGGLLEGNYSRGAWLVAKRILAGPSRNRSTALLQLVGALEWQAPEDMVAAARKELTANERARLESEVQAVIAGETV